MNQLQGKVAVITGGSRGLGLAIAQGFVREGAAVVIGSRSADSVAKALGILTGAGGQASGVTCDVAELTQVQALANHAISRFGKFDIWINNAGLSSPVGPTMHLPPQHTISLLKTNILGVYNGSRAAMQHFVPRHAGKLINISGMGEKQRFPMHNPYTTSKSWLYTFTMNLAEEYKESGVGVFLFNPGLVETEMYRYLTFVRGYESGIKTFNVVARLFAGPPEPAVEKAVWLASSATDGRTGLRINRIGMGAMLAAVLREAGRMLSGKPAAKLEVNIQTIEPALDVTLPFENALPVDAVTA